MQYIGIMTQQRRNNFRSGVLLVLFPIILLAIVLLFFVIIGYFEGGNEYYDDAGNMAYASELDWNSILMNFARAVPGILIFVGIWFIISYFSNVSMIRHAVGARPLERKDNPRIYNLVENLCMSCGMNTPKINIVDDPELNAFASGIDEKSYTVTLTSGIIDRLNDDELEGVIGHELTHIRNKDTRLLIISIIFVGILATLSAILFRVMVYMPRSLGNSKKEGGAVVLIFMLVALICCSIGYFFTVLTRFAISRKREFMADAGSAELTGNPMALASALRKISDNPGLTETKREDVAQLFIYHKIKGGFFNGLFSTHPDINERIRILEQF
jgi:heat shock protein HtpX